MQRTKDARIKPDIKIPSAKEKIMKFGTKEELIDPPR